MTAVPSGALLERVSRTLEENPRVTKSALSRLVRKGNKQSIMRATDILIAQGYVQTTPAERAPVLTSVRPYRCDPGSKEPVLEEPPGEPPGDAPANQFVSSTEEPPRNHGGGYHTGDADPDKHSEVRRSPTGNGSEPAPRIEPRCRCCRDPVLRAKINGLLAGGYTLSAVLAAIAPDNAALAPKARISIDSLTTHRARHFPVQAGASALYRKMLEDRLSAEAADYERGVVNLVNPRLYLETMLVKGYETLISKDTSVSVGEAAMAARELGRLADREDDEQKWARVHAQQARIIAAFREVVPSCYHEAIMDRLDGRTPPPPGGARLALVEGGQVTGDDDEFDPLGDDDDDKDLDDD